MPGLFEAYPLDSGVDALPSDGCAPLSIGVPYVPGCVFDVSSRVVSCGRPFHDLALRRLSTQAIYRQCLGARAGRQAHPEHFLEVAKPEAVVLGVDSIADFNALPAS
jgi:hypothetical protein